MPQLVVVFSLYFLRLRSNLIELEFERKLLGLYLSRHPLLNHLLLRVSLVVAPQVVNQRVHIVYDQVVLENLTVFDEGNFAIVGEHLGSQILRPVLFVDRMAVLSKELPWLFQTSTHLLNSRLLLLLHQTEPLSGVIVSSRL